MDTFFIKPREGITVIDPITREALPETGASKPRNKYWLRRELDGDVIAASDKPKTNSKKP